VVLGGLALLGLATYLTRFSPALYYSLRQRNDCPWVRALTLYSDRRALEQYYGAIRPQLRVLENQAGDKLLKVGAGRYGEFWMSYRHTNAEKEMDELGYLLAEHQWVERVSPREGVRTGDVVLDVGGHVGVFTRRALGLGASRVVVLEPDPALALCLRRNFAGDSRVTVVEAAAWRENGAVTLRWEPHNSGTSSVIAEGERVGEVRAVTIDSLRASLELARVDYIKMDIEGAEREALAGARATLRAYRPQLMIDVTHGSYALRELPDLIHAAHPGYRMSCGPCESDGTRLAPHVLFFR
jgi:FkbM family methyltransferase